MSTTARIVKYQNGSLSLSPRAKGPDAWVFRWRELQPDGTRKPRSKIIGTVDRLPTDFDAKKAVEKLRSEINVQREVIVKMTVGEAWTNFQQYELYSPVANRSSSTIAGYLAYFSARILPHWQDVPLDDVNPVDVEDWLQTLMKAPGKPLSPGAKSKIKAMMHTLFRHAIRRRLFQPYQDSNPINTVRQGAKRLKEPEVLTLAETKSILDLIESDPAKVMLQVAAASGLRRSEIRGLKWENVDLEKGYFLLCQGFVGKFATNLKTEASRRKMPIATLLVPILAEWKKKCGYSAETDWVFASPVTGGETPYWPDAMLKRHIRPAAVRAKVTKKFGWHTFRHSLATLLGYKKEDSKTVQEIMGHASRKMLDVYQHGDMDAKRAALDHTSGLFTKKPVGIARGLRRRVFRAG
jgi:integrase